MICIGLGRHTKAPGIGGRYLHLPVYVLGIVGIKDAIKVSCRQLSWLARLLLINLEAFHSANIDNFFD